MTLAEFVIIYLEYSKVYKKSYRTDCSKISKYIIPVLGGLRLSEISRKHIQDYINGLVNLKFSTRNRHLALLKAIFSYAVDYGYRDVSPAAGMKAFREPASMRRAMEPAEFQRFISVLRQEIVKEARDTLCLLEFLALTGMRLGEARSALIQDADRGRMTLFLRDTKSGDSRLVPLCQAAIVLIDVQREKYGMEGLLFRSSSGEKVSEPRRLMAALCENAGITRFTIHELRYTAGSAMLAATRDIYAVKQFLGHKQISTSERYARYFGGQQHADVERAMQLMMNE
ncbi:tyrosine-type recombinase/integrase [Yersinia enterocolitica]|uniref:tyrosine-type recombinase/integrase n=1 Tax=Yersinia TaxID=629 RepID=UPI0005AD2E1A|nr:MULTISPECIES: site-specific integrase [Yersinia]AJJ63721.1 hypothetical protein AT01_1770 [Yersinia aldovae 670-83]HDL7806931.1 site-specific integrase [Yersinia enterocolitica]